MISVVITTYKNKELLIKNLKINFHYLKDCEIIVVNDNPLISIKKDLSEFPISLIENKINLGFGGTANLGFSKAVNQYVLLLNDDVVLQNDNYEKALNHFQKNPDLFAVSFAQKEKKNQIVGKNKVFWKNGLFYHAKADDTKFGNNAWAEGGSCIIDKSKFEKLGGFDPIYAPFYWEDIDLCYRAWKYGYKIFFDPSIEIVHHHESTIGKQFPSEYINKIAFRNQFIFIWKNIIDFSYILNHLFYLPYNLIYYLFKGKKEFLSGFSAALEYIILIAKKGKIEKIKFRLTDKQIFKIFKYE